jgi:hypothetical protein
MSSQVAKLAAAGSFGIALLEYIVGTVAGVILMQPDK